MHTTELRGSCGDGKEVRCHDLRTILSTARGKIIIHSRQTVLLEDRARGSLRYFGWLPNLLSNKCRQLP